MGCHGKVEIREYQLENGTYREVQVEFYRTTSLSQLPIQVYSVERKGVFYKGESRQGAGDVLSASEAL